MITVYLDNNIFDKLIDRGMDLNQELPPEDFKILITREVELELLGMPEVKRQKALQIISSRPVKVDWIFGFDDPSTPPQERRYGGPGESRFSHTKEIHFINTQKHHVKATARTGTKTPLKQGEADLTLAARSFHSVVLTTDAKKRPSDPLHTAKAQGAAILLWKDFEESGTSLSRFISTAVGAQHGGRFDHHP